MASSYTVANEQQSHADAETAALFSYAIKLTHTRLREFAVKVIQSKDSRLSSYQVGRFKTTHSDFNNIIYFIRDNWKHGGFSKLPNQTVLWKHLDRATTIRNFVAHQETYTDSDSIDRDIETLCHTVKEIGFPDDVNRIRNYNKPPTLPKNAKPLLTWEQLKQQANDHYKEGRYTEAMIAYTKALKENANEPSLYSNRALCEINLNRLEDARNDAEDALELDPKNVMYYRILSEALQKMELIQEALSVCFRGLQLDSKDEVLLIRERDLKSLAGLQKTNQNPRADPEEVIEGNTLWTGLECISQKYNDLKPDPNDIRYVQKGQIREYFAEHLKLDGPVREGHNYSQGMRGRLKDEQRAFQLFKTASDLGSPEGQYNVGIMYGLGCGTNVDYALMLKYLRLAADHKPFVQLPQQLMPEIGKICSEPVYHGKEPLTHRTVRTIKAVTGSSCYVTYVDGLLAERRHNVNFKYKLSRLMQLIFSASRKSHMILGVAEAENALGNAFRDGTGVDVDLKTAFSHYTKAAGWGQPEAQNNLGWCLQWEKGVKKNLEFARIWYERAAKEGLAEAQLNYAEMLEKGEGGPRDESRAFEFYKKSAEQGSPGAIEKLHRLARNGSAGKEQQKSFGEMLGKKAASGKDPHALYFMGSELQDAGDFEAAVTYYKKAAEKGHLESKVALWKILLENLGRNAEAFSYCSEASTAGDAQSQMMLAMFFLLGIGCARDTQTAVRWFHRAQHRITPQLHIGVDKFKRLIASAEAICKFEEDHSLPTKDMKWLDRIQRFVKSGPGELPQELRDLSDQMIEVVKRPRPVPFNKLAELTGEGLKVIFTAANNGSTVARNFIQARMMINEAFVAWEFGEYDRAFSMLRESHRYDDIIKFQSPQMAAYIDDNNLSTPDALFVRACNFCNDVKGNTDFLERCIRLYPMEADLHHMLACCYGFAGQNEASIAAARRAYELEPRANWLYTIATGMRNLCDIKTPGSKLLPSLTANDMEHHKYSTEDVIAAYERYLQENPKDERKVPAALFCIALIYTMSGPGNTDGSIFKAKSYYEKACAADAARLACFEAVEDTFPPKTFTKMILHAASGFLSQAAAPVALVESVEKHDCNQCGKANPPSRCVCRKAVYCGKECQKLHWRIHKRICNTKVNQPKK